MQQHLWDYIHQYAYFQLFCCSFLMACERYFSLLHYWTKVASVRWFVIIWLQNPSLWNFSMRVSLMCLNAVPYICGILLVLWHLASILWMFNFNINIHNIHLIHNRCMAYCSKHQTTIVLLWAASFQLLCNGLECTKLSNELWQ